MELKNANFEPNLHSFIPLFFQDASVLIKSNTAFIQEATQNWKLKHLTSKKIVLDIDPPPRYS